MGPGRGGPGERLPGPRRAAGAGRALATRTWSGRAASTAWWCPDRGPTTTSWRPSSATASPSCCRGRDPTSRHRASTSTTGPGARAAVEHLIGLGHRRIACVTNAPLAYTAAAERSAGYRDALEAAGIEYDERLVAEGAFDAASGQVAMVELLRQDLVHGGLRRQRRRRLRRAASDPRQRPAGAAGHVRGRLRRHPPGRTLRPATHHGPAARPCPRGGGRPGADRPYRGTSGRPAPPAADRAGHPRIDRLAPCRRVAAGDRTMPLARSAVGSESLPQPAHLFGELDLTGDGALDDVRRRLRTGTPRRRRGRGPRPGAAPRRRAPSRGVPARGPRSRSPATAP